VVLVCVWTSGSSPCSQKGWLFKDKSADELQTHTFSNFIFLLFYFILFFANLFTCETEQQQQQRQQQQKLNFFEKIGGENLTQFPTQVSQNQKNREKETSLLKT
jgi:hypothetical protein